MLQTVLSVFSRRQGTGRTPQTSEAQAVACSSVSSGDAESFNFPLTRGTTKSPKLASIVSSASPQAASNTIECAAAIQNELLHPLEEYLSAKASFLQGAESYGYGEPTAGQRNEGDRSAKNHLGDEATAHTPRNIDCIREHDFTRLGNQVYLDHAGSALYSEQQIKAACHQLQSTLLVNPHSAVPGSFNAVEELDAQLRRLTLEMCNASCEEYEVILTSGATAALKLVGECFPWGPQSPFVYTVQNHNSVLGIREAALDAGAEAQAVDLAARHDAGNGSSIPYCICPCGKPISRTPAAATTTAAAEVEPAAASTAPASPTVTPRASAHQAADKTAATAAALPCSDQASPKPAAVQQAPAVALAATPAAHHEHGPSSLVPPLGLFAFPLECNFSGQRFDQQLVNQVHRYGLHGPAATATAAATAGYSNACCQQDPAVATGSNNVAAAAVAEVANKHQDVPVDITSGSAKTSIVSHYTCMRCNQAVDALTTCQPLPAQQSASLMPMPPGSVPPAPQPAPKFLVLLDAAKACATHPPDLSNYPADFVALSYYKIFGFPSGLGALLVRKRAMPLLRQRFFGGGAVLVSVADEDFVHRRPAHAGFEHGTLPFTSLSAACEGFNYLNRLGGFLAIQQHTASLTHHLVHQLSSLQHANGQAVAGIYGWQQQQQQQWVSAVSPAGQPSSDQSSFPSSQNPEQNPDATCAVHCQQLQCQQAAHCIARPEARPVELGTPLPVQGVHGPTVTFNLLRADGSYVGYSEVLRMASLHGIYLRSGCFCNPGACAKFLGLTGAELRQNYEAGHVCWDDQDIIRGKPTGAIRVSLGHVSTFEDVHIFLNLVKQYFVEGQSAAPSPAVTGASGQVCVERLSSPQAPADHDIASASLQSASHKEECDAEASGNDHALYNELHAEMPLARSLSSSSVSSSCTSSSHDDCSVISTSDQGKSGFSLACSTNHGGRSHATSAVAALHDITCQPAQHTAAMPDQATPAPAPLLHAGVPGRLLLEADLLAPGSPKQPAPAASAPAPGPAPAAQQQQQQLQLISASTVSPAPATPGWSVTALSKHLAQAQQQLPVPTRQLPPAGRLTHIFLYPIKSCAAQQVSSWPVGPNGLLFDREWALIDDSCQVITQKRCPAMARIQPTVDLANGMLTVSHPALTTQLVLTIPRIARPCGGSSSSSSSGTGTGSGTGRPTLDDSAGMPAADLAVVLNRLESGNSSSAAGSSAAAGCKVDSGVAVAQTVASGVAVASDLKGQPCTQIIHICGDRVCGIVMGMDPTAHSIVHTPGKDTGSAHSCSSSTGMGSDSSTSAAEDCNSLRIGSGTRSSCMLPGPDGAEQQQQQQQQQICRWFAEAIGVPCRLVQQVHGSRTTNPAVHTTTSAANSPGLSLPAASASNPGKLENPRNPHSSQHSLAFANEGQFLLINQSSLQDLNARLLASARPLTEVDELRFRPNIVVAGFGAYDEDHWNRVQVGALELGVLGSCRRCEMLQVDQCSGVRGRPDVLLELAQYRRSSSVVDFALTHQCIRMGRFKGKMHFGILLTTDHGSNNIADHAAAQGGGSSDTGRADRAGTAAATSSSPNQQDPAKGSVPCSASGSRSCSSSSGGGNGSSSSSSDSSKDAVHVEKPYVLPQHTAHESCQHHQSPASWYPVMLHVGDAVSAT